MNQSTRPGDLGTRHRNDDPPVKITREIPLPWLIGVVVSLIVHAVILWISQQNTAQAIKDMAADIRELRADARQGGLKTVEHEIKLTDHERRIQLLEARKP
jgi:mannitol-specific phosphotransferase system IIBC component